MNICGDCEDTLNQVMEDLLAKIQQLNQQAIDLHQPKLYEHLISRIKTPASMVEKCQRKGYPVTTTSALRKCKDAIGSELSATSLMILTTASAFCTKQIGAQL